MLIVLYYVYSNKNDQIFDKQLLKNCIDYLYWSKFVVNSLEQINETIQKTDQSKIHKKMNRSNLFIRFCEIFKRKSSTVISLNILFNLHVQIDIYIHFFNLDIIFCSASSDTNLFNNTLILKIAD